MGQVFLVIMVISAVWPGIREVRSGLRGYKFTYDGFSRLKDAVYGEGELLSNNTNHFNEQVTGYDKNGNILGLLRYGQTNTMSYDLIDKRDIDYVNEAFEAAYRGKKTIRCYLIVFNIKNGSIAYIQMIASYYEDKAGRPYFYGDFINITEVVNARKIIS